MSSFDEDDGSVGQSRENSRDLKHSLVVSIDCRDGQVGNKGVSKALGI